LSQLTRPVSLPTRYDLQVRPPFQFFDHTRSRKQSEACFAQALEVAAKQQAKSFQLRAATCLAGLWLDEGKCAEARDLLAPIYGWFTEGLDTLDLKRAKALLAELGECVSAI
jgi:predicted ATPase